MRDAPVPGPAKASMRILFFSEQSPFLRNRVGKAATTLRERR